MRPLAANRSLSELAPCFHSNTMPPSPSWSIRSGTGTQALRSSEAICNATETVSRLGRARPSSSVPSLASPHSNNLLSTVAIASSPGWPDLIRVLESAGGLHLFFHTPPLAARNAPLSPPPPPPRPPPPL